MGKNASIGLKNRLPGRWITVILTISNGKAEPVWLFGRIKMYFKLLWSEFALLSEVESIALGGSRAGTDYDGQSDYDLYIYCTGIPCENVRSQILEKCCRYITDPTGSLSR